MITAQRLRRLFAAYPAILRYLQYLLATLIVFIVVGGSLQAFFDFMEARSASALGLLLIGTMLTGVLLYVYVTRPELRPSRRVGLPAVTEVPFPDHPQLRISSLSTSWQLEEIARLAARAFGSNAMPLSQIRELHWHCRDTVFLLLHADQGIVGYMAVMFPAPETVERMLQGTIDTLELKAHHFVPGPQSWQQSHLYLESVVVAEPNITPRFLLLVRHVLQEIEKHMVRHRLQDEPLHVFALEGSTDGGNLLRRFLGLTCVAKAEGRADEMAVYAGEKRIEDIRMHRRAVETKIEALLDRRGPFS